MSDFDKWWSTVVHSGKGKQRVLEMDAQTIFDAAIASVQPEFDALKADYDAAMESNRLLQSDYMLGKDAGKEEFQAKLHAAEDEIDALKTERGRNLSKESEVSEKDISKREQETIDAMHNASEFGADMVSKYSAVCKQLSVATARVEKAEGELKAAMIEVSKFLTKGCVK